MPKISVLVPIYNVERYLKECLDSIMQQTLNDIEIICINDGSTDQSGYILGEYAGKDKRIKVINKPNSGYGHSMNIGLDHASGEYIAIVESDDFASPEMLERMYQAAVQNDAEVIKSNYYVYRSLSGITDEFFENLGECEYNQVFSPIEDQRIFFSLFSIWSGIYRRDFLLRSNIRFLETPGASHQDTSFAFCVFASARRVLLMKDAFIHYRVDNAGSSTNSPEKVFCIFDEYQAIEHFLDQHPDVRARLNKTEKILKFRAFLSFYYHLASAFQYTFLLRAVEELKKDAQAGLLALDDWNETEWKELHEIMNNPNRFFKNTAKDYHDDRVALFKTLNSEIYLLGLVTITDNYKRVIVYGAGAIGKRVVKLLANKKVGLDKIYIAVTEMEGNPESISGCPVSCIKDYLRYKDESIVIVATKERLQYDIQNTLQSLNFTDIILIDTWLLKIMEQTV